MLDKFKNRPLGWYLCTPLYAYRKLLHYRQIILQNQVQSSQEIWRRDSQFQQFFIQAAGSGQDMYQYETEAYLLYYHALQVRGLSGEVAEVGVYQGGSAKLLAKTLPDKTIYLFDTFTGMPPTDPEHDMIPAGIFAETSLGKVESFLADCPNVSFHPGWFPETAIPIEDKRFSFVHVDGDIYQTTQDAISFFYPRMTKGGIMAFHDYVQHDCPGVREAIHDFFDSAPETIIFTPPRQCFIVKT